MARYHASVMSLRPAAETFGYLADFSNAARWDPGVLAAERLDPGPVGAGTRFRLVVPFLGRPMVLIYRITSYGPGHTVTLAAASRLLDATDTIAVTGGPDTCTVSYAAEVRLRGPLGLLDPLLRPGFRAVAGRGAAGLGRALSGAPLPPGRPGPGVAPDPGVTSGPGASPGPAAPAAPAADSS
jgi:dehydrogenase/reductase SDR family member 12